MRFAASRKINRNPVTTMARRPAMPSVSRKGPPPDQAQRERALDPARSILVRAPAGSGKTELLTRRFLRLLGEVDDPGQIVAITFTRPAAAEMRNRILSELEKAVGSNAEEPGADPFSTQALAHRALARSQALNWNLLDLPAQLRISTIDSFCRDLALQQPLLSGLGGGLDINEQPKELYRRAARRTLEQIAASDPSLREAIEALLLWRDNSWPDLESQLVGMLEKRDQWMHDFVLDRDPDWDVLRSRLERSFARAAEANPSSFHYSEEEWHIVRSCFTLLRHAAAELKVVLAEAATADFIEVAQIALNVLKGEDGLPNEAALGVADGIRHLLVDEFQDTSRRQHQLLAHLIAAWPEREGRTCFVVGDPMQSIYFFRDADAELFPRVEQLGLEIPGDLPLRFAPVHLTANFRTAPALVDSMNHAFARIFAVDDGSGVTYSEAEPARGDAEQPGPYLVAEPAPRLQLHLEFVPESPRGNSRSFGPDRKKELAAQREAAQAKQIEEIVALIRSHMARVDKARSAKEKYRIAVLGRARTSLEPIAAALRQASIPFRAVELEKLQDRPEIIDALALARALLNPHDRVAWLGVLRAPWCGLSLADLHTLVSADSAELLACSVSELLSERSQLLSAEGREAVERLLLAIEFSDRLRSRQLTAALGTWLEAVWLRLGGAQCVDAAARANLDLLWGSLDGLPEGEPDLLGSALDAALDKLTALPDPEADSDCGVQLMTIHKAKGLEFEVVIVPDLQKGTGGSKRELLSWLERGLPPNAESASLDSASEITEFLVAPFQRKGADSGKAKQWVDRVRRDRESQEARRLLYVAATRAREELHLFARPKYKMGKDGKHILTDPTESLLKKAWPAFEEKIEECFGEWRVAKELEELAAEDQLEDSERTIESIAASSDEMLLEVSPTPEPPPEKPTRLRRLPPDFAVPATVLSASAGDEPLLGAGRLYERHEGGLLSRELGKAVHALLQQFAQLLTLQTREVALSTLTQQQPRIAANIRAAGIEPATANRIAAQALQILLQAAGDPLAQWILAPHADAASEVRWTGVVAGSLRTVQVDRVFRAGPAPQTAAASPNEDTWWIIDYKTAHEDGLDPTSALPELRRQFAPQIEAYAAVLRNLRGAEIRLCGGLYYPRMALFDWWQL
jgi:ATP-dependent exoDNAse (exonuclease V) beta subunit